MLLDEFFAEGDDEKAMGLDVGAMNDREKVVIPKAQVGFINFITKPLWTMWRDFAAPTDDIAQLRNMRTNLYAPCMFSDYLICCDFKRRWLTSFFRRSIWQSRIEQLPAPPLITASSGSSRSSFSEAASTRSEVHVIEL